MITLAAFEAEWTNKKVGSGQCVALIHQYLADCFGLTDPTLLAQPSAYEIYTNFANINGSQYFNRVQNTPEGVPSPGDIVIIGPNDPGAQTGPDGHICIFVSGDVNNMTTFDANYPTGSLPHLQHHTYSGILGWLTPRPQGTFVDSATFEKLVSESTAFESFVTAGYNSPQDVNQKLQSFTSQISDLQKQVGDANNKNEELLGEISNLQQLAKQASELPTPSADQGLEAIQQAKDLSYDINLVASELQTTYPPVKNLIGEVQTIKNKLLAAQIELTKQANLNAMLQKSQQNTKAVVDAGKGFFSSLNVWLKNIGVLEK